MKPTAFSYVRFSTRGQISGDSLSRQIDMAREYARRHDLHLDELSYRDLGISAFRGKNATEGALKAFLDAVDDGTIPKDTTLLVESLDRISRAEVDEALELLLSITKRGVTVVTLADEQVYNRKTIKADWSKLIVGLTYMARAHEESARKSARSKRGMQSAIKRGVKHAKCPWQDKWFAELRLPNLLKRWHFTHPNKGARGKMRGVQKWRALEAQWSNIERQLHVWEVANPDLYKELPWHAAREEFKAQLAEAEVIWPTWWELAGACNHAGWAVNRMEQAKKKP